MPAPAVAIVLAFLLIVAAWLLLTGLRGQRVNAHPYCRFCGFDLFGQRQPLTDCSECGADLKQNRNVRIGRRHRLVGRAAAGMALLPLSLAAIALFWSAHRGVDFDGNKPVFWLLHDVQSTDTAIRDAALRELSVRVAFGKLSAAQITWIVDRALMMQADDGVPWDPLWGQFLEKAQASNALPAPKWTAYVANALRFSLRVRPTVGEGDPLPWTMAYSIPRVGPAHPFYVQIENISFNGTPINRNGGTYHLDADLTATVPEDVGYGWHDFGDEAAFVDDFDPNQAALGQHTAQLAATLEIYDAPNRTGTMLFTQPLAFTATWSRVRDAESVRIVDEEKYRVAIARCLTFHLKADRDGRWIDVSVDADSLPIALAFSLQLEGSQLQGDSVHDSPITMAFSAGKVHQHASQKWFNKLDILPTTANVVLEANAAKAAETLEITEIWGGRLEIRNVPIERK